MSHKPGLHTVCSPGIYMALKRGVHLLHNPDVYMERSPGVHVLPNAGVYMERSPGVHVLRNPDAYAPTGSVFYARMWNILLLMNVIRDIMTPSLCSHSAFPLSTLMS